MNYIEKCLFDYKANLAEIETLNEEINSLMSLHGQSYGINNNSLSTGDPVANCINQKLNIERKIAKLKKRVNPVERLLNDLNGSSFREQQMKGILVLRYIGHEDKEFVKNEIAISEATFWRRNRELLRIAKRYFFFP